MTTTRIEQITMHWMTVLAKRALGHTNPNPIVGYVDKVSLVCSSLQLVPGPCAPTSR